MWVLDDKEIIGMEYKSKDSRLELFNTIAKKYGLNTEKKEWTMDKEEAKLILEILCSIRDEIERTRIHMIELENRISYLSGETENGGQDWK